VATPDCEVGLIFEQDTRLVDRHVVSTRIALPTRPMPRQPRSVIPEVPLHITQRGVNRGATFLDEKDYGVYLWALHAAAPRARCAIHAYVLMTNHVHLLLTPSDARGPATLMGLLGAWYVRYFNDRRSRTGPLWEGRYRSRVVTTGSYFFACSRYIELNPVRAGMVDECTAYPWSSFHHNACGQADPVLTPHSLYSALGSDRISRCSTYRALFADEVDTRVAAEICTAPLARSRLSMSAYQEVAAEPFGQSGAVACATVEGQAFDPDASVGGTA